VDYECAEKSFNLRQALRDANESIVEREFEKSWGSYGNHRLVGHGEKSSPSCGQVRKLKACLNVDLHNRMRGYFDKDGKLCMVPKDCVVVRPVPFHCGKPSCPVCYKSWAAREADRAAVRLQEGERRFHTGCEHIVCSVPLRHYGLDFERLRSLAVKALYARGVVGGMLVFHAFRYQPEKGRNWWFWSPHFHVLGFLVGGYKCRYCHESMCSKCSGFEHRTREEYERDGFIVKVLGERKSIFWTLYYQLNHCSYDVTKKHYRIACWYGVLSYRKLKFTPEKKKELCPLCQHEFENVRYFGSKKLMLDPSSLGYHRYNFEDFEEEGHPVFIPYERGGGWSDG
jgi:hypothetical protein